MRTGEITTMGSVLSEELGWFWPSFLLKYSLRRRSLCKYNRWAKEKGPESEFANLAGQLGLGPPPAPVARAEVGNFTWDLYAFERPGGIPADLALAEDGDKAYFVYLVSAPD